jgi:2-keto-4-pentenoate hydratase
MPNADLQAVIQALVQARQQQHPVDAAAQVPRLLNAEQAYKIQSDVAQQLDWFQQETPRYWKSGGPTRAADLTHAPLPPAGIWPSPATTAWPFTMRGIEAEIALRLAVPVDAQRAASLDQHSASCLIDAMTVSIEVVDSRWTEGPQAPALLKLADLQSHGALVLGQWIDFDPAHDWSTQICRLKLGDAPEQVFCGSHSLGDPAYVLPAWLRHATRDGAVLPAGTVVTTGTWCGLLQAQSDDVVMVSFDGIGEIQLKFEG